jgi:hypothetical protein
MYYVVLGCSNFHELRQRCEGLVPLVKDPADIIIISGVDKGWPKMQDFLMRKLPNYILVEDKSTNTVQNVMFTFDLINMINKGKINRRVAEPDGMATIEQLPFVYEVTFVSSKYHMHRVQIIVEKFKKPHNIRIDYIGINVIINNLPFRQTNEKYFIEELSKM